MISRLHTIKEARKAGLGSQLTSSVTSAEARNGALDSYVAEARRNGRLAALVLVKGTAHDGLVQVWQSGCTSAALAREKNTRQARKRYLLDRIDVLLKNGLCSSCSEPRGEDGTSRKCRRCADRSNESQKRYLEK